MDNIGVEFMNKETLKKIKNFIKDFKSNREYATREEKRIIKENQEHIKELNLNTENYFDRQLIDTLNKRTQETIFKSYENFGNDANFHFIYKDGSECCVNGTEIVSGDINPKLTDIAYVSYEDGWIEMDTENGELNFELETDEDFEKRNEYFDNIERKFQTVWGKSH